jgi:hypothetical protein
MFPIGDTRKAAECIESLNDHSLRHKIIKQGYELVKNKYSHQKSVDYWDEAFRKILSSSQQQSIREPRQIPISGRLDRVLGVKFAETVRCFIGKNFIHNSPGGEWPHSYGKRKEDDKKFWSRHLLLDKFAS